MSTVRTVQVRYEEYGPTPIAIGYYRIANTITHVRTGIILVT